MYTYILTDILGNSNNEYVSKKRKIMSTEMWHITIDFIQWGRKLFFMLNLFLVV